MDAEVHRKHVVVDDLAKKHKRVEVAAGSLMPAEFVSHTGQALIGKR